MIDHVDTEGRERTLRRVASDLRHNRQLNDAMELERIANALASASPEQEGGGARGLRVRIEELRDTFNRWSRDWMGASKGPDDAALGRSGAYDAAAGAIDAMLSGFDASVPVEQEGADPTICQHPDCPPEWRKHDPLSACPWCEYDPLAARRLADSVPPEQEGRPEGFIRDGDGDFFSPGTPEQDVQVRGALARLIGAVEGMVRGYRAKGQDGAVLEALERAANEARAALAADPGEPRGEEGGEQEPERCPQCTSADKDERGARRVEQEPKWEFTGPAHHAGNPTQWVRCEHPWHGDPVPETGGEA